MSKKSLEATGKLGFTPDTPPQPAWQHQLLAYLKTIFYSLKCLNQMMKNQFNKNSCFKPGNSTPGRNIILCCTNLQHIKIRCKNAFSPNQAKGGIHKLDIRQRFRPFHCTAKRPKYCCYEEKNIFLQNFIRAIFQGLLFYAGGKNIRIFG